MAMRLTHVSVTRSVKRAVRRKRAERKRRAAKAAALWKTEPKRARDGSVRVPRRAGGGRRVPWSASEQQMMLAKRQLRARERAHNDRLAGKRAKCGTNAGYHAHLARNETTCPACRKAHNAYNARYR